MSKFYTKEFIDNGIETEGARMLSESLKANTVLSNLNLRGEYQLRELNFEKYLIKANVCVWNDNKIGIEGSYAFSEALKINTSLTKLNIECGKVGNHCLCFKINEWTANWEIKEEGARIISEAMKKNQAFLSLQFWQHLS